MKHLPISVLLAWSLAAQPKAEVRVNVDLGLAAMAQAVVNKSEISRQVSEDVRRTMEDARRSVERFRYDRKDSYADGNAGSR